MSAIITTSKIISWLSGKLFSITIDWLKQRLFSQTLPAQLEKTTADWASKLPSGASVHHEALFPEMQSDNKPDERSALVELRETIAHGKIPTTDQWFKALFEQWSAVRVSLPSRQRQAFFNLSPQQASLHLRSLARNLSDTCAKDRELFQTTIYGDLRSLLDKFGTYRVAS